MQPCLSVHAYVVAAAVLACCWLPVTTCIQMAECPIPEGDQLALCAKCSDSFATVRWSWTYNAIHTSPSGYLVVSYNCVDSAGQPVNISGSCFDNGNLADVYAQNTPAFISRSSRVHAIDIALTNGTSCTFTGNFNNGAATDTDSCQIKDTAECERDPEGCVLPIICEGGSDGTCSCNCEAGFETGQCDSTQDCKANGLQCLDIDDCENTSTNDCHENAVCTNKYGEGFHCNCSEGFEGNGFICTSPVATSTVTQQMTSTVGLPTQYTTTSLSTASPTPDPLDQTPTENPVLIVSGLAAVFLVAVAGLCVGGAVLTAVLKDRRQSKRKAREINETLKTLMIKNVVDLSFSPVDAEKIYIPPESPVTVIHELELVDPELLSRHPELCLWLGGHDNHSGIGGALSLRVEPHGPQKQEEQQEVTTRNDLSGEYLKKGAGEVDEAWAATTVYEEPSTAITPTLCDEEQVLEHMPVALFSNTNKGVTEYLPNDQSVELTMDNCKPYIAATLGETSTRIPVGQEQTLEILFAIEEEGTEPVINHSAVEATNGYMEDTFIPSIEHDDYYGTRTVSRGGSSGYVENNLS